MLPSPPGVRTSLALPSPPTLDLEPSPTYSPLSTPSQSPRPPPSPPLGPASDCDANEQTTTKLRDREREIRELKKRVEALQREKREAELAREKRERSSPAPSNASATTTPPANTATMNADTGSLSADNIALRSTLRLLMLQRDRAKRDIHTLEEMREDALREPLEFIEFIQSQKAGRSSRPSSKDTDKKPTIFTGRELPKPQEIYRCPPIEWSQYRILGTPLDALHEKQRRRASPSRPSNAAGQGAAAGVPPSMQTGGIIGMPPAEYGEDAGLMQGRLRMFDGIGQRGSVVGR